MKSKGEIVLICAILGFVGALVLLFPQVRGFLFGGGGAEAPRESAVQGEGNVVLDLPRTPLPMDQYTPFFRKLRFAIDGEDGVKRFQVYYWFAPPKPYPPGKKFPLVVFLHDKDGRAPGAVYLRMKENYAAYPAFVLVPQAPAEKVWSAPAKYSGQEFPQAAATAPAPPELHALPDVIELMSRLTAALPIDDTRIYAIGCGEGGAGVYGAAANYGGIFAGGVVIGGAWSYLDGPKMAKTPLLLLHGAQDTVVPPELPRTMREVIKRYNGTVFSHEFRGIASDCQSPHYYSASVWKWLFSQRRPAAPAPDIVATPQTP